MSKVAVYIMRGNGLAKRIVPMLAKGATQVGDDIAFFSDEQFSLEQVGKFDTAIFWGYVETLQAVMLAYNDAGKAAVYLDLAYWHRDHYYKVSVGARHPTAYFQKVKHPADRRELFGIYPAPYRKDGKYVLLAGLSAKGAWAEKEGNWGDYEKDVVENLRQYTDRVIIYRAKTRGKGITHSIPGTRISTLLEPLKPLLAKSWAVVTRHSNVAVDGLVDGIPAFAQHGVASVMAGNNLKDIEQPWYPEGREQWLNDVAYCQWSEDELKDGTCWRHLKNEGLVK